MDGNFGIKMLRARIYWRFGLLEGVYEDLPGYESIWADEESGEPDFYNWEEGNLSCDCNRSRYFGLSECPFSCGSKIEVLKMEIIE